MWTEMIAFLKSFFLYPGLRLEWMLIGIAVAVVLGAVWLLAHWPPLFKKPWLWAVAVVSAFLTLLAITFVQIPLQIWVGQALTNFWDQATIIEWLLLAGAPSVMLSGLVQEGSKMVPVVVWWWRSGRNISPMMGLAIGAVAGAAFGILEAVWTNNSIFMAGWTLEALQTHGFVGIAGFWERFFVIGLHTSVSALAGYGLAKGKGCQFYLIAAGLHTLLNYGVVVRQYIYYMHGFDALVHVEVWVAVVSVLVTVWALLLRWGRAEEEEMEPVAETAAGEPPPSEPPQAEPRD